MSPQQKGKMMNLPQVDRFSLSIESEAMTKKLAAKITQGLMSEVDNASEIHTTIWLSGELGSGKTSLTRAILESLGYKERVKSPTYNLIEAHSIGTFQGEIPIYHFDLYRFHHANEWFEAGFDEYWNQNGLRLIEWPERAIAVLPPPDISLTLMITGENSRKIDCVAHSKTGAVCLKFIRP